MQRIAITVAAAILAAAGLGSPVEASPPIPPPRLGAHAAPPSLLLPARYRRHRRYHRDYQGDPAATDGGAGTIKPGQWEFAAQLEAAALPAPGSAAAPGAPATGGGATKSTYAICVAPDKAVPSAFVAGCRLDAVHRDGGRITWSMTCTNGRNAVRSDGVAQYRGDTMTATMVSHLPGGKAGKTIEVAQYITGRYVGACPSTATTTEAAATPLATTSGAAATSPAAARSEGTASATAEPEASTAAPATAAAAPPEKEQHLVRHRRYRRYRRHYAYRRRYGGGWYGNGTYSGLGPNPYSANGY